MCECYQKNKKVQFLCCHNNHQLVARNDYVVPATTKTKTTYNIFAVNAAV